MTRRAARLTALSAPVVVSEPDRSFESGPGYVRRTLVALEHLAIVTGASPDELATVLRVHRRTVTRLLDVLVSTGWVRPSQEDPGTVELTPKILTLAGAVLNRVDLIQLATSHVRRLRDRAGESAHLAVPIDGFAVQVAESLSPHALAVRTRLGEQIPLHCSAVGKVLAASLPEELERCLSGSLTKYTPKTITSPDVLRRELDHVTVQGFAIDDTERYADTRCVAAPVRDVFGQVVASLGISGPAGRLDLTDIARVARMVIEEAESLSTNLGHNRTDGAMRQADVT